MLLSLLLPALPALACGNRAPTMCGLVIFCFCLSVVEVAAAELPRPAHELSEHGRDAQGNRAPTKFGLCHFWPATLQRADLLLSLPLPALPALARGNRAPKKCGLVQFCTCLPRRTLCSPSLSPASLPRPGGGWSRCLLLGLGSCFPRDTGCLVASVAGLPCLPTASEGATRPMLLGFPRPSRRWTRLPVLIRGSRAPAKFGLCHFCNASACTSSGQKSPNKVWTCAFFACTSALPPTAVYGLHTRCPCLLHCPRGAEPQ